MVRRVDYSAVLGYVRSKKRVSVGELCMVFGLSRFTVLYNVYPTLREVDPRVRLVRENGSAYIVYGGDDDAMG